jgi:hypothetical protein
MSYWKGYVGWDGDKCTISTHMDEASDDQWRNITDIADTTTLKILQQNHHCFV